jgi:gamma-tubulin complex component 5
MTNDEDSFHTALEYVSKSLEFTSKAGPSMDLATVEKQVLG